MPVLFKFRSSVGFDAVDLGGCPCISVRDLRARVVNQKNLQICADSRLVVFDAGTGEAYEDEEFMIPDGSSVIVKRVPAAPENGGTSGICQAADQDLLGALVSSPSKNVAMDNFDDFGNDLLLVDGAPLQESDSDERSDNSFERGNQDNTRCSESPASKCQNQERSNLSEAFSKVENVGENYDTDDVHKNSEQPNLQRKEGKHMKLAKAVDEPVSVMPNLDLPTELQCSLCNKIFKEAVMIPCCQHSFCDKCIHTALVDKGCCPRCSSTKCRIEDLLPNLSLRHAIEHFLEAQVPIHGLDKVSPRYAPDGESGIHAKEASCPLSIRQLEHILPHSPSVTGKGSNQVVAESACETLAGMKRSEPGTGSNTFKLDGDRPAKAIILLHKDRQPDEKDGGHDSKPVPYFEDHHNFMKLSHTSSEKKEVSLKKKKGLFASSADASGTSTLPPSRLRKGERNCFMCGSPDHLIRDCPAASSPYQFLQTENAAFHGGMPAYGATYWHSNSYPYMRPFTNVYGTPGLLPFDPSMKSIQPFGLSYMSPMYAGLPVPWMGGVGPPMIPGASRPFSHVDVTEFHDGEPRRKNLKEHREREEAFDEEHDFVEDYYHPDSRRKSSDHKTQLEKGVSRSYSDEESLRVHRKHSHDGYLHASCHERPASFSDDEEVHSGSKKHERASNVSVSGRDSRTHYSERSYSSQQDDSDSLDKHTREKSKHRHKSSSKRHSEKRGKHISDHSHKCQSQSCRDTCDELEKSKGEHKKHIKKHLGNSEPLIVPDTLGDKKKSSKEEISHRSRHKHKEKFSVDQLEDDRWELVDGLNEAYLSDHWYHKHRKTR